VMSTVAECEDCSGLQICEERVWKICVLHGETFLVLVWIEGFLGKRNNTSPKCVICN
jgi:hypothetical protein